MVERLFLKLLKNQNDIDHPKTYYVENNLDLVILEVLSFIFAEEDLKLIICQNVVQIADENEIPFIFEQNHIGKNKLHRRISETLRRIKNKYN